MSSGGRCFTSSLHLCRLVPTCRDGCHRNVCLSFGWLIHTCELPPPVSSVGYRPLVGEDIPCVSQVSAPSISELGFPGSPPWTSEGPPVGQSTVSEDTAPVALLRVLPDRVSPSPPGVPAHILLNTTGLSPPARADRLELLSVAGQVLKTLPIRYFPDRQPYSLWNITAFIPPEQAFFLRVTGYDPDGFVFQRASSVSFSSIKPGP